MKIQNSFHLVCLSTVLAVSIVCGVCDAQQKGSDTGKAEKVENATLKGRLVQSDRKGFEIDLAELNTKLNQRVQLPQPKLPGNWAEMKLEQRQSWYKAFNESDAGKSLVEKRKAILDAAATFDLKVEKDGNFVVYDVPMGTYGMRGRAEKVLDNKTFVFEVFGQIDIKKDVEEVLLDPVMVSVTRILKADEPLPDFKVPTFDGKTSIVNKLAAGKYVLFSFWSLDSPPSLEFSKNVQQMYEKVKADHELQLISVCIGSEAEKGLEHVKKNSILGWHGHAKDWQHPILQDFGIRAIPSLCLADKNGKLLMSPYDFALATRQPESDLSKIVSDAITGKNKPTPKTAESEAEATTASRKN